MISNCTQYGPLVVELLIHQFSFPERYYDLMKDGCFTFKLRGVDTSAFVGNDVVIEDVNLLADQFCHKRELFDKNLKIETSSFVQLFKDDCKIKFWLRRGLIHFDPFKNKQSFLHNEFSSEKQLILSFWKRIRTLKLIIWLEDLLDKINLIHSLT